MQPCPNRKINLPKEEDNINQNTRQPCPLLIGQTLLVCSLCDIFTTKISYGIMGGNVIPKVGEKEEGGQSNTVSVDVGKLSQDVVLNSNQSMKQLILINI